MQFFATAVLIFCCVTGVSAEPPSSNRKLQELKDADQSDREKGQRNIDWVALSKTDIDRQALVFNILRAGELRTDTDFYNAALVFQHGGTPETSRLAHALATVAYQMNNENKAAKWLSAASWDRLMMTLKRPQWYATQFTKPHGSDTFVLYDIDETVVSDETRKSMGARSVADARAHAEELSKK